MEKKLDQLIAGVQQLTSSASKQDFRIFQPFFQAPQALEKTGEISENLVWIIQKNKILERNQVYLKSRCGKFSHSR